MCDTILRFADPHSLGAISSFVPPTRLRRQRLERLTPESRSRWNRAFFFRRQFATANREKSLLPDNLASRKNFGWFFCFEGPCPERLVLLKRGTLAIAAEGRIRDDAPRFAVSYA